MRLCSGGQQFIADPAPAETSLQHHRHLGPLGQLRPQRRSIGVLEACPPEQLTVLAAGADLAEIAMDVQTHVGYACAPSHGCLLVRTYTPDIVTSGGGQPFMGLRTDSMGGKVPWPRTRAMPRDVRQWHAYKYVSMAPIESSRCY